MNLQLASCLNTAELDAKKGKNENKSHFHSRTMSLVIY